jgi:toxin YoeB
MRYKIELTPESDIEKHKKSGDKKVLIKIDLLLNELRTNPSSGIGKAKTL